MMILLLIGEIIMMKNTFFAALLAVSLGGSEQAKASPNVEDFIEIGEAAIDMTSTCLPIVSTLFTKAKSKYKKWKEHRADRRAHRYAEFETVTYSSETAHSIQGAVRSVVHGALDGAGLDVDLRDVSQVPCFRGKRLKEDEDDN